MALNALIPSHEQSPWRVALARYIALAITVYGLRIEASSLRSAPGILEGARDGWSCSKILYIELRIADLRLLFGSRIFEAGRDAAVATV
jgi:hypothetical protein